MTIVDAELSNLANEIIEEKSESEQLVTILSLIRYLQTFILMTIGIILCKLRDFIS